MSIVVLCDRGGVAELETVMSLAIRHPAPIDSDALGLSAERREFSSFRCNVAYIVIYELFKHSHLPRSSKGCD